LSAPNYLLRVLDETLVLAWLMSMGYGLHHLVYIVTSKTRIHVSRGPVPSRIYIQVLI
jgi:hypothetical protein